MKTPFINIAPLLITICLLGHGKATAQQLDDFSYNGPTNLLENVVRSDVQFNGYTNHWHNDYRKWIRYGNLFKMSIPDAGKNIAQSKVDLAEDLQVPGLSVQEGFVSGLFSEEYITVEAPSLKELEESIGSGNVLVFTDPGSQAGKKLMEKFVPDSLPERQLKSYQFGSAGFKQVNAFILENGGRTIFVVASKEASLLKRVKELLENTKKVLSEYDLHKGMFGAETLLKSVTCVLRLQASN